MATEIPNSTDSPDPLSTTPPRFAVIPTVASISSTVSETDSLIFESPPSRRTRLRRRQHQYRRQSNSPESTATLATPMSSESGDILEFLGQILPDGIPRNDSPEIPNDLFLDDHYNAEPGHDDLFDAQDSGSESLFVNDRYEDNDLDVIGARYIHRRPIRELWSTSPEPEPWLAGPEGLAGPEEYLFRETHILDRVDRVRNVDNQGDELVEMEVQQGHPRNSRENRQRQPRAQPEVIDLTGDSDNFAQPAPITPRTRSQNARRQRSQQRGTPPRLARSDASYMGSRTVIDLISDSDEEPEAMQPLRNDPPRPGNQHEPQRDHPRPQQPAEQEQLGVPNRNTFHHLQNLIHNFPIFRLLNPPGFADNHDEDDLVMLGQRNLEDLPPNLPAINGLNYVAHPFANPPQAPGGANGKPAHEPPKETREGFTRDTGEDVVAICPSCDEELAYDPDADEGNPTKKPRTKKDKAEHHFWAVKACGHVYCRKCYENRKPVGKKPVPVGFRRPDDPNGATKNKVICAVEDCDSDVSAKNAWVGIFL